MARVVNYSDEEIEFLTSNFKHNTYTELAVMLEKFSGRVVTDNALAQKLKSLGYKKTAVYVSGQQNKRMLEVYAHNKNCRETHAIMLEEFPDEQVTIEQVRWRCYRKAHNLKKLAKKDCMISKFLRLPNLRGQYE